MCFSRKATAISWLWPRWQVSLSLHHQHCSPFLHPPTRYAICRDHRMQDAAQGLLCESIKPCVKNGPAYTQQQTTAILKLRQSSATLLT